MTVPETEVLLRAAIRVEQRRAGVAPDEKFVPPEALSVSVRAGTLPPEVKAAMQRELEASRGTRD